MERSVTTTLHRLRAAVMADWIQRLRAVPVVSALALPASLTHLMVGTLDELAVRLGDKKPDHGRVRSAPPAADDPAWPPSCHCGRNPFLAYYLTGEAAVLCLLSEQGGLTADKRADDAERVRAAWRALACAELQGFCSLCRFCGTAAMPGGCQARAPKEPGQARRPAAPRRRQTKIKRVSTAAGG